MKQYPKIDLAATILLLIGGVNWGFVGLLDFDVIGAVVGFSLARIIFIAVGLSAIWRIVCWCSTKHGR